MGLLVMLNGMISTLQFQPVYSQACMAIPTGVSGVEGGVGSGFFQPATTIRRIQRGRVVINTLRKPQA